MAGKRGAGEGTYWKRDGRWYGKRRIGPRGAVVTINGRRRRIPRLPPAGARAAAGHPASGHRPRGPSAVRPPGWPVPNSSGQFGEGLDVRGDGGLIVAAPSLHASGHRYRWSANPDRQAVAAMPVWRQGLLRPAEPPHTRGDGQALSLPSAYATAALSAEVERIRTTRRRRGRPAAA